MRQHTLLIPTLREAPSEAETMSHKLLLRAGFIRQVAAGIYTYLPLGWRVLKKISDIVRDEMVRIDAQEILMPAAQPAELWHESGRYSVYGEELIRFKDRHDREFILGPTHEEVITSLVAKEIDSYKRLPFTLYQIQSKFRDERRPRFGLIRGREFLMKDAYSFDTSWEELDHTYWNMFNAYTRIFNRCGLNFRPVEAEAGAIGGEGETHEFMALSDIGEDTVVTCNHCEYASNLEKASEQASVKEGDPCPRCSGRLQFHRGIELGHVFKLGAKYSEKLGANYLDSSGKEQAIIMGCYGIGISRIISALVEQNHDKEGIIWSMSVAPFHVHLIIVSMKDQTQIDTAEGIYQRLQKCKIEVLLDDRDERPGVKFKDADLMGIPIRITIGKHSSEGQVEYKHRRSNDIEIISIDNALSKVVELVEMQGVSMTEQ